MDDSRKELERVLKALNESMKEVSKLRPDKVCAEYQKLNGFAIQNLESDDPEMRKFRRAVMLHPWSCNNTHCVRLREFMYRVGLDNITHPKYGLINKGLVSDEKQTMNKLK
jgi:hypothetical protein